MVAKKVLTNSPIAGAELFAGGVLLFQLPKPGHLIVAENAQLPCGAQFSQVVRGYYWAPPDRKWYGKHAHISGQELYICLTGQIRVFVHDGRKASSFVIHKGDAVFIPTGVWHQIRVLSEGSSMWVQSDAPYDREKHYQEGTLRSFIQSRQS